MEETELNFLGDEESWTKSSFLTDLFEHLNKLNSSMQGRDENILTSLDKIMAFIEKLNLWKTKINQEENLCSIKNDRTLQLKFKKITLNKFLTYVSKEYPEISIKALTILLPFSTSYLCEQGFSELTNIKNKKREKREKLNSVEKEMRVCLSTIRPRIKNICNAHQAHISH
ncbi:protein FAM200A-like [Metopolophium dirhodum]|uniref:protein FAM200A-like n=1 Tax=Metopolophium dirhodum TaxID=44670 RepID=UPI00298FFAB6|nr:protein FAM200A-like [Metopolophium dirhodum]